MEGIVLDGLDDILGNVDEERSIEFFLSGIEHTVCANVIKK